MNATTEPAAPEETQQTEAARTELIASLAGLNGDERLRKPIYLAVAEAIMATAMLEEPTALRPAGCCSPVTHAM